MIQDLVAYQAPLTQVFSLPRHGVATGRFPGVGRIVRTLEALAEEEP